MAVKRFHANGLGVEQTAPEEFVTTYACDDGQTVQIVHTTSMALLFCSKVKQALPKEEPFE